MCGAGPSDCPARHQAQRITAPDGAQVGVADAVGDQARRHWLKAGAAWLAASAAHSAFAQGRFPERAITLVVPFAPGGSADLTARAVADAMAKSLGQAVLVDNRPSAGSIVATQLVAQAKPDGHTLLLMSNSNALSATLLQKLPCDTLRDFAPISTLGFFDLGLFVAAGEPNAAAGAARIGSLVEALTWARAHPGKLTIGSIAVGSIQHLAAELFKTATGIDALIVPYKGSPALLTALRAGEKLNRAAREAVASAAVNERLGKLGMRLGAGSPAQAQALLASEIKRWAGVIRAARIEPE